MCAQVAEIVDDDRRFGHDRWEASSREGDASIVASLTFEINTWKSSRCPNEYRQTNPRCIRSRLGTFLMTVPYRLVDEILICRVEVEPPIPECKMNL